MKLFDLLKKNPGKGIDTKELEIYSGMRVVVEYLDGQTLFVARLQDPQGDTARLYQYSEDAEVFRDIETGALHKTDSIFVNIRGYNESERKAVFMEGLITPEQKHLWQVKRLAVTRIENERSYSRFHTDIDAAVMTGDHTDAKEQACRLLDISVGGAGIRSKHRYNKGDKFLLKFKLTEDTPASVMYCKILRVIEKESSWFEYGCCFLDLTEANQEQLTKSIARFTEEN